MDRGGPQHIPRPRDALKGGPPPWIDATDVDLSLASVEQAIARRGQPVLLGEPPGPQTRRSAVLVPLYEQEGQTHVVLTRRASTLRSHRHEVAFPGGRLDPTDQSEWHAAIREAEEEVALDPDLPRKIGELDSFVTGGSFTFVTPFVGALPTRPSLTPAEAEVEHILHVPLSELLLPEVYREEIWQRDGVSRPITFFELHGDTVWGATGSMLRQLLAIVTGSDPRLAH